ncbi:GNAT family N-acetyltransferase [Brachybacterium sp. EF45031]|uniref:GNAT family N-acetyltransferase n=1 Tax=Brachybacterium sillae TaxID=2810536 RepID=UPI00217ED271|nr:GNAT family N-acetyltransferase [Brachybacterium sillae]MCS6712163.1 GNAT family N-acetyltransferase [Brachybacterium sillae]
MELPLDDPIAPRSPRRGAAGTSQAPRLTVGGLHDDRDAADFLALNAAAFAHHPEQGTLTREDLDARRAEPWFSPADVHLARLDGRPAAVVWIKRAPGSATAEVYVVATHPEAQGRGLASMLLTRALEAVRQDGARVAELFVEADSIGAVRLYETLGFRERRRHVQYAAQGAAPRATTRPVEDGEG